VNESTQNPKRWQREGFASICRDDQTGNRSRREGRKAPFNLASGTVALKIIFQMIFVSYSHRDKQWLRRFQTIFKPICKYAEVSLWSDEQIEPGAKWPDEINKAMERPSWQCC
jgi:hypothetical protein